jgi:hypothetical protein
MATNQKTPPFTPQIEREPMRPDAEDHVKRAAMRMAELHGHHGEEILDEHDDRFYVPPSDIPPGWDYQWKRLTLLGKEDPGYQVRLARAGWEPVPLSRHAHYMPEGYDGKTIVRDGQILMERPKELTLEAERLERKRARDQVRIKEDQLASAPQGQFERDNKGAPLANIKKNYVPMPVPE